MNRLLFFVFTIVLFISCNVKESPDSASFTRAVDVWKDLVITQIDAGIFEEFDNEIIQVPINQSTIFEILAERELHYIYVRPGDSYTIDTIADGKTTILQEGGYSAENIALETYEKVFDEINERHKLFDLAAEKEDRFLALLDAKYQQLDSLLNVFSSNDMDVSVLNALKMRSRTDIANEKMNYENIHSYVTKESPELSEEYYQFMDDISLSEPSLLLFESGRQFAESIKMKELPFDPTQSVSEYFNTRFAKADELLGEGMLSTYSQLIDLESMINFGGGIDGASETILAFEASTDNPYFTKRLNKTVGPWKNLIRGKESPDFKAYTREGNLVNLTDLKGKRVYIDVWATWCGPCIREIPSLKELEHDLAAENVEFVSVSIDVEAQKEKWLSFIDDKELGGLQLFADGAWESDLVKGYNIKGIPRFILIDENGKIISANAPRPSEESTKSFIINETI